MRKVAKVACVGVAPGDSLPGRAQRMRTPAVTDAGSKPMTERQIDPPTSFCRRFVAHLHPYSSEQALAAVVT
jgi:hypothetical protein